MSEDRSWIVATILDIEATRGEFEAAALAASPNDLAAAMGLLDEEIARALQRRRDLLGYRAHLLEQYPALGGGQG